MPARLFVQKCSIMKVMEESKLQKLKNLLNNNGFYAIYNFARVFLILYLVIDALNIQNYGGLTPLFLTIVLSIFVLLHSFVLQKKRWTIFLLPITFGLTSYSILTVIHKFDEYIFLFGRLQVLPFAIFALFLAVIISLETKFQKFKYVTYILSFLIIIIILVAQACFIVDVKDFQGCSADSECVAVAQGCCGCGGGGKNVAINKKFLARYNKALLFQCTGTLCPAVISNDISCIAPPVCRQSRCTLNTESAAGCENSRNPEQCYYTYALANNNANYCNKIQKQSDKIHYNVSGLATKEQCIFEISSKMDDITLCERLDGIAIEQCRDAFYASLASKEKDVQGCYSIKATAVKDSCLRSQAYSQNNVTPCKDISDNLQKAWCFSEYYTKEASSKKDSSLCEKIVEAVGSEYGTSHRDSCLQNLGRFSGNTKTCDKISDPENRKQCKLDAAIESLNYKYCLEIADDHCLWYTTAEIAPIRQNEACPKVMGTTDKNQCYEKYVGVCRLMQSDHSRDRCIEEVSVNFLNDKYCAEIKLNDQYSGKDKCYERVKSLMRYELFE